MCPDAEPLLGDTQGKCSNLHLVRYNIICPYYANAILWGMDNPFTSVSYWKWSK